jgi:hypothetical protein
LAYSDQQLHSVLHSLEECRALLAECENHETADLVSIAILDLRMKLNQIASAELKALCDEMLCDPPAERSGGAVAQGRLPLLRVVK